MAETIDEFLVDFYKKKNNEDITSDKIDLIKQTYQDDYDALINDLYNKYDEDIDEDKLSLIKTTYDVGNVEKPEVVAEDVAVVATEDPATGEVTDLESEESITEYIPKANPNLRKKYKEKKGDIQTTYFNVLDEITDGGTRKKDKNYLAKNLFPEAKEGEEPPAWKADSKSAWLKSKLSDFLDLRDSETETVYDFKAWLDKKKHFEQEDTPSANYIPIDDTGLEDVFKNKKEFKDVSVLGIIPYEDSKFTDRQPLINADGITVNQDVYHARTGERLKENILDVDGDGKITDLDKTIPVDENGKRIRGEKVFVNQRGEAIPYSDPLAVDLYTVIYQDENKNIKGYSEIDRKIVDINDRNEVRLSSEISNERLGEFTVSTKRNIDKEIKDLENKILNTEGEDKIDLNLKLNALKSRKIENALLIADSDDLELAKEGGEVFRASTEAYYGGDEKVKEAVENVEAVKSEITTVKERLDYLSKNRKGSEKYPGASIITDEEEQLKNKLDKLESKTLPEVQQKFDIARSQAELVFDTDEEFNSAVDNFKGIKDGGTKGFTIGDKFNNSKYLEYGFYYDTRNEQLHANVPRDFLGRPVYVDPGEKILKTKFGSMRIDTNPGDNKIGSILGNEDLYDIASINQTYFTKEGIDLINELQEKGVSNEDARREAAEKGYIKDQNTLELEKFLENSDGKHESQYIDLTPEQLANPSPEVLEKMQSFLRDNKNDKIKIGFDKYKLQNVQYYHQQEERKQHATSTKLNDIIGEIEGVDSPVHTIQYKVTQSQRIGNSFNKALEFYGTDAISNVKVRDNILNNNKLTDNKKRELLEKEGFVIDEEGNITGRSQEHYETVFKEYNEIPIKEFTITDSFENPIYNIGGGDVIARVPMVTLTTPSDIELELTKEEYDNLDDKITVKDHMVKLDSEIQGETLKYLDLQDDVDHFKALQIQNMIQINDVVKLGIKERDLRGQLNFKEGAMGNATNYAEANWDEAPAIVLNRVSSNLARSMGGVGAGFARIALLLESPFLTEKEEKRFEKQIESFTKEVEGLEETLQLDIDDEFNVAYNNSFFGQAVGTGIDMLVDVLISRGGSMMTGGVKMIGRKAWKQVLKTQTKRQISKRGLKEGLKFLMKVNPAMMTRQYGDYERQFSEPRFDGMSNAEKFTYAAGMSFLIGKMDRLGIETAAGKGGDLIAEAIFRRALQSGKKGTLKKILNTELKEVYAKGLIKLGTGGLGESVTEVVQELTEQGASTLVNAIKGFDGKEEGFEAIDWGSEKWFEEMKRIMQVSFFSAGPSSIATSAITVVKSTGEYNNLLKLNDDNFRKTYALASSPETIAQYKEMLQAQVSSGQKTQKEASKEWKEVQDLQNSFKGVPIGLNVKKARAIYENNLKINDLEKSKEGKNNSAVKDIDEEIKLLEEANEKIISKVTEEVTQVVDGKEIKAKVAKDKYKSKASKTINTKIKGLKKAYKEAGIAEDQLTDEQLTEVTQTFTDGLQEAVAKGEMTQAEAEQNLKDFKLDNINLKIAESSAAADAMSNNTMVEGGVRADASYDPTTNTIVIDKEQSIKIGATNSQNHEGLHHILAKTLEEDPEAAFGLATALATELDKLDSSKIQDSDLKKRMELYESRDSEVQAEELLTLFSDAVETGDIVMNDNVFTKIGDLSRRRIQDKTGATISFETAEDVYNFIKDYNTSINKGKFTEAQKSLFKKGAKIGKGIKADEKTFKEKIKKTFKSKSLTGPVKKSKGKSTDSGGYTSRKKSISSLSDFDNFDWKGKSKNQWQASEDFRKAVDWIYQDKGFDRQIANKLFDGDSADVKSDLIGHLMNFDPKKQYEKGGSLAGWMSAQFMNKVTGVGEKAGSGRTVSLDATMGDSGTSFSETVVGETGKTIGETKKTTSTKPKVTLDKKLKISKPTNKVIENAVEKVNWTKLKSIEEGTETIPTVTPFISDLKKQLGPELTSTIIAEMGGSKKGPAFGNWLDDNIVSLIEDLPIQYIAGSVFKPFHKDLVQKSVGGKYVDANGNTTTATDKDAKFVPNWTSNWQGEKVDRVKTRDTGNTAGPQMMRLKPGWKSNVNINGIKGQFVKPNGSVNQTRQEGLAYQVGSEVALEFFGNELKKEDSKVKNNFQKFQTELAGRKLADNFVETISDQLDRNLSKKSMSFVRGFDPTQAIAFELGKKDFIQSLNGDFSLKNIRETINDVYGSMVTDEGYVFNGVTKTKMTDGLFKTLKQYTDILETTKRMPSEFKAIDEFVDEELNSEQFDKSLAAALDLRNTDGKKVSFGQAFNDATTVGIARDTTYNIYKNNVLEKTKDTVEVIDGKKVVKKGLSLDEAIATEFEQVLKWDVDHLTSSAKIGAGDVFVSIKKGDNKSPNKGVGSVLEDGGTTGRQGYQYYMNKGDLIVNTLNRLSTELGSDVKADFDWKRDKDKLNEKGEVVKKGEWKIVNPRVINSKTGETLSSTKDGSYKTPSQNSKAVISEINKTSSKEVAITRGKFADEAFERVKNLMQGVKDQLNNPDTTTSKVELGMMMMSLKSNMASILRSSAAPAYMFEGDFEWTDANKDLVYEHMIPAEVMAMALIDSYFNPNSDLSIDKLQEMYNVAVIPKPMDDALKTAGYQFAMPTEWKEAIDRYFNERTLGAPSWVLSSMADGKVVEKSKIHAEAFKLTNKPKTKKKNSLSLNNSNVVKTSSTDTNQDLLDTANNLDKSLEIARDPDSPVKKIRVFDFDDTIAETKSNVLYTTPDGKKGKLTPSEYAQQGTEMLKAGVVFDFSEFNKVIKGKKGPLFELMKKMQDAAGDRDLHVLTARAIESAPAIQEFLKANGIDIAIENITGLGDSSPYAKSGWIVDKAAEGFNDFYFADDHSENVRAVRDALEQLDVKSQTQVARKKHSLSLNQTINNIIENKFGVENYKTFSDVQAQKKGKNKGRFNILIPPSAEDFVGLIYPMLGKGETGNQQMQWFKDSLLDPYARAMNDISRYQQALMNDFRALKKELIANNSIPKNLRKEAIDGFSYQDVARILAWSKQGITIDGLSKADLAKIEKFGEANPEISLFADELIAINKGNGYSYPGSTWNTGNITTDLKHGLDNNYRTTALKEWQKNADIIFSNENLNKMEAVMGSKWREAMDNMLHRMKTGKNKNKSVGRLEARLLDYINNSVGAIMFLNTKSAVLQTISSINFINFSDNNPLKAGLAFANQKQYWKDFTMLMNSDFLRDRRGGMKLNVSESEIADAANTHPNKVKGVISYLLNKGFLPTQIADSFAIASGGATFYRNRVKTYLDQGFSIEEAEAKAFKDFRELAEESQQSSRPDRISQQQAGGLGRVILAFANTPAQYTRLTKKAVLDLANGRGDWKHNLSKIIYYTFAQNLIFNALQQALFGLAFGDDDEEEEEEEKYFNVANGMIDSILRGLGLGGAIVSTLKNIGLELNKQMDKDPFFNPDAKTFPGARYDKVALKTLDLAPPIDSKITKLISAGDNWKYNNWRPEASDPFSLKNPAYKSAAQVISATTNFPIDRVFYKMENIEGFMDSNQETWKRISQGLGWSSWMLESKKEKAEQLKKDKSDKRAAKGKKDPSIYTKTQQEDILRQHGYTQTQIDNLSNEEERVKAINAVRISSGVTYTSDVETPKKQKAKSNSWKKSNNKPKVKKKKSWKKLKIK